MARLDRWLAIVLLCCANAAHAELPREVKLALAARDYETAIAWLQPNARAGDADAAYELGKLYRLGKGVSADRAHAAEMFSIAAQAGNAEAQYLLALHQEAEGMHENAATLMRTAAAAGHARAARWLAKPDNSASTRPLLDRIAERASVPTDIASADLAVTDAQGITPLMAAVQTRSADWTSALIAAGADLNAQDKLGNTALHYAISAESAELVSLLLDAGADTDIAASNRSRPLHVATATGNVAIARALLNAGASPELSGEGGWSAVQLAARSTDPRLRSLFGLKADPTTASRAATGNLQRQLALAARNDDIPELDRLIRAGADPVQPDASGANAIEHAITAGQLEATRVLLGHADQPEALADAVTAAAAAGEPDILRWLLGQPMSPARSPGTDQSALTAAVQADCTSCVALLLNAGADPSVRVTGDTTGDTLLLAAIKQGHGASAAQLVPRSDPDAADVYGRTALWWASKQGMLEICELLLAHDANVTADQDGINPLHIAAAENHADVVAVLLGQVDVEAPTPSGNTALILAASRNAAAAAARLLGAGAQIETRNGSGNTALIVATEAEAYDVAGILLEAGASPTTRNKQFDSARSIAERRGDERLQQLLADRSDGGLLSLFD